MFTCGGADMRFRFNTGGLDLSRYSEVKTEFIYQTESMGKDYFRSYWTYWNNCYVGGPNEAEVTQMKEHMRQIVAKQFRGVRNILREVKPWGVYFTFEKLEPIYYLEVDSLKQLLEFQQQLGEPLIIDGYEIDIYQEG
jgi:hypothetical protein